MGVGQVMRRKVVSLRQSRLGKAQQDKKVKLLDCGTHAPMYTTNQDTHIAATHFVSTSTPVVSPNESSTINPAADAAGHRRV